MKSMTLHAISLAVLLSISGVASAATGPTPGSAPGPGDLLKGTANAPTVDTASKTLAGVYPVTFYGNIGASPVCPTFGSPQPTTVKQSATATNSYNYDLTPLQYPAYFVCNINVDLTQSTGMTEDPAITYLKKNFNLNTSTNPATASSCAAFNSLGNSTNYAAFQCVLGDASKTPPPNEPNASFCVEMSPFASYFDAASTSACYNTTYKVSYSYGLFAQINYGGNYLRRGFHGGGMTTGTNPLYCSDGGVKLYLTGPTNYELEAAPQEMYTCSKSGSCSSNLPCSNQGGALLWFGGNNLTCNKNDGSARTVTVTLYPNKKNVITMSPTAPNSFLNNQSSVKASPGVCSLDNPPVGNRATYP